MLLSFGSLKKQSFQGMKIYSLSIGVFCNTVSYRRMIKVSYYWSLLLELGIINGLKLFEGQRLHHIVRHEQIAQTCNVVDIVK